MENQGIDQGLFNDQFIQPWPFPSIQSLNPCQYLSGNEYYPAVSEHDGLFASSTPSSIYDGVSCGGMLPSDQLGFGGFCNMGSSSKMSAQEIMDAKAQAASKSHSEAERRRRERINAHLARLRSLLPSTTKTDKASLLAEVISHLKELKRQTSEMADEINPLPTETNELTLDTTNDGGGKFIVKASLCCEDRSDLIPELIKALKSLRLRTVKAEITTLGGRVKNILVITGEDGSDQLEQLCISSIQDAIKAVMEGSTADESYPVNGGIKRQRTNNFSSLLQGSM